MKTVCMIPECGSTVHAKGLCQLHYRRDLKHGDAQNRGPIYKGGIRKHPLYGAWAGMRNRCENPNHSSYHQYGARGVTVCERWADFRNFLTDMGERPEGMTIDRIDPTGPYSPDNCRWATAREQRANLSQAGAKRQREGASSAAKQKWAEWRSAKST